MEELDLPELTSKQIEELCVIAEEVAREHILSKVASKRIETLNIIAEAEGEKPVTLAIDVEITLSPLMRIDVQELVNGAVKKAFESVEKHLRELKCRLQK